MLPPFAFFVARVVLAARAVRGVRAFPDAFESAIDAAIDGHVHGAAAHGNVRARRCCSCLCRRWWSCPRRRW